MPMNSLVCIGVPTTSGGQGTGGQGGGKLKLTPLTPRSLPSIPSHSCHSPHSQLTGPHSQCPMNSLVCIGVPTTSGGKGQGGSKLKLAPLTPRSLPSLPSPCCHSHLIGPHSQCPMNSFLCIGVPTTSDGKGQGGSKLKLAPLTPRSLPLLPPCSSSLPACSTLLSPPSSLKLAPSLLQLASSLLQLAPTSQLTLAHSSSLQLTSSSLQLATAHSQLTPTSQLTPACFSSLQLAPAHSHLAPSLLPACSSLLPMGNVCVWVPTTSWV